MGLGLQLAGARFSNVLVGKLSQKFKLPGMSIFHEIQMAIFRYCVTLQSRLGMLIVLHILYMTLTVDPIQDEG